MKHMKPHQLQQPLAPKVSISRCHANLRPSRGGCAGQGEGSLDAGHVYGGGGGRGGDDILQLRAD